MGEGRAMYLYDFRWAMLWIALRRMRGGWLYYNTIADGSERGVWICGVMR